jgi:hypothetical protein
MKNKKANVYVVIGVVVLFVLIVGGIILVSGIKNKDFSERIQNQNEGVENQSGQQIYENMQGESQEIETPEVKEEMTSNCQAKEDCEDNDNCTLESCTGGVCISTEVLLCYNNDGCCPEGCNSRNDNDCLGVVLE